jgi:2-iminoacetate synthase
MRTDLPVSLTVHDAVRKAACGDAEAARIEDCLDPHFPLEELGRRAAQTTRERFCGTGPRWRMLLYAPLYLSSHCLNHCLYCGFRAPQAIQRRHLSVSEAVRQVEILMGRSFRHILLVAGDFPRLTTTAYFAQILRETAARGVRAAVEIAPQSTESYAALAAAGACGLTLFQETYDKERYAHYHPRGTKASYDWRLAGPQRAAEAGVRRLGLGFLLGLADPREDLLAMARHAAYLEDRFPGCSLGFSLPRIREAPAGFVAPYTVDDDLLVRMYCALRLAFPGALLVLSTREHPELRNRLAKICITQMSAGSSTSPGGYDADGVPGSCGQQFPVCDRRLPAEMADWLRGEGFDVSWLAA